MKKKTPITEEKWFKELPISERIIWLRIIRQQMIENLQATSKIIYTPHKSN